MSTILHRLLLLPVLLSAVLFSSAHAASSDLNLDAYKGKVVYIDFWASWCGPCKQSFPWMKAMHEKYNKEGLVILAVNVDQEKKKADDFLKEYTPDFPVIFDSTGTLATQFKVQTMPSSYMLDRNGKPRYRHLGFHDAKRNAYEKEIRELLSDTTKSPEEK
jgi:thiol-disulfide isomerase/thioredoxin